jgi:hypothetical protein
MKESDRGACAGGIGRRGFVLGCAAGAGVAGAMALPGLVRAEKRGRMRIRIVYALHAVRQDVPDWPNLGFDFAPVMEQINHALTNALPEIEFLPSTASGAAQAEAIVLGDLLAGIDGYIVYQMNGWNLVAPTIAATRKPVLFVDYTYGGSGGFLVFNSIFLRSGVGNVGFVSSLDQADLIAAAKCFETSRRDASGFGAAVARVRRERTPAAGDLTCRPDPVAAVSPGEVMRRLRQSKILAVGYPGVSFAGIGLIPVEKIGFAELAAYGKKADRDQAREIAARWRQSARVVEGVSAEVLADSAAMYLGMKAMLERRGANAITVNCLQGFYGGQMSAYPCLGFFELCNTGQVGACECDVRSAATMLAMNALTGGRPGYISDPIIDTSRRQIVYAHCVSSNLPFGPTGPANPFEILTHSEDRKGASVRSLLPEGYMTTTVEFGAETKKVLIHQAKTMGNDPNDRACRTKLAAEPVGDLEKLFTAWDRWGWHRVTVYGDLAEPVSALAEALGYKVVKEA